MPSSYQRANFLKENMDGKEKTVSYEKKNLKNQEASMRIMREGFESLTAGVKYLIDNAKKLLISLLLFQEIISDLIVLLILT